MKYLKTTCSAWTAAGLLAAATVEAAGPLLTDSNLFASLNLTLPGLEAVQAAMAETNYPAARAALGDYLRARTNVAWYFDPHAVTNAVSYNRTDANNTVTGRISSIGIYYTFPAGNIDWFYNITKDPLYDYDDNNEWQWQMNRMSFWPNLGNAYWGTASQVFAQAWASQLRDWLTDCPVPSSVQNGAGSAWRTIEAGIRMGGNWPNAYHRFLTSPSVSGDDLVDYLKSCVEHARYLRAYYTRNNWLTMEMSGLYTAAALYPELNESAAWRTFAAQKLYMEQTNQFYPDGAQVELSPGYLGVALGNILTIYNVALLEGRTNELPADYLSGLEKAYAVYMNLATPDRRLPQFNDSISQPDAKSYLLKGAQLFPHRTDFTWVASNGASGAPPDFVSWSFPYAGWNVMRSGWETNAHCLVFDAGPLGYAHQHQDKLNVVLWCQGRRILFDSGGGDYETSVWRSYGTSSFSHNTVVVDGKAQSGGDGGVSSTDPDYVSQGPQAMRWESDLQRDFAFGVFDRGYGGYSSRPAAHRRRVLFVKPDIYLVADTLTPADGSNHTYQARWHLIPTNTVTDPATRAVTTTDAGAPNLAVVPCLLSNLAVAAVVAQTNPALLGWDIRGGIPGYNPATTVTHDRSGTGVHHFVTLLLPLAPGATNPVTAVTQTSATSATLDLADGRRLLVYADPNPARGLRLVELDAGGATNRIAGAGFVPPAIGAIPDGVIDPDETYGPVAFLVSDADAAAASLVVRAAASDPALVPPSGIQVAGAGSNRTIAVTPAPGLAGRARIDVTAIDPDGSTVMRSFTLTVDAPPQAAAAQAATPEESPVEINLRPFVADDLTPAGDLRLAVVGADGGTADLRPDGQTVRFTPASNFAGQASVRYVVTDIRPDPRLLMAYTFEPPDGLSADAAHDFSPWDRTAEVSRVSNGVAQAEAGGPEALAPWNRQGLRLQGTNDAFGGRMYRAIAAYEFNFSTQSWTFSGWFRRDSTNTDDFIFYLGNGDGFGANEELQLNAYRNQHTVTLQHYVGEATNDISLQAPNLAAGAWHHVAVVFNLDAPTRRVSLHVDGAEVDADTNFVLNLTQSTPAVFGGHNGSGSRSRWFDGRLDDLAVFQGALEPEDLARLASGSVAYLGGRSTTATLAVAVADINDPPVAAAGARTGSAGVPLDVDLRTLVSDPDTAAANLLFEVGSATHGTVSLLADGYTARVVPAPGYTGTASFAYSVTDQGPPADALLHYRFEPPDDPAAGVVPDRSGHGRTGAVIRIDAGAAALSSSVPPALVPFETASLRLSEYGTNGGAKVSRLIGTNELDLAGHDWTYAGWFRRPASSNDDFIFYVGAADGFSSGVDELHLFGPAGVQALRLFHFRPDDVQDVSLSVAASTGAWHHAAVTWQSGGPTSGVFRMFLDGALAGTTTNVSVRPRQDMPVVFGGHQATSASMLPRLFNGELDDVVLFTRALGTGEIARLAGRTVAHFGGYTASNTVTVATTTSSAPPVVFLGGLTNEAILPYPVTLAADATAGASPLVRVDFLADGRWIGSDASSPYAFAWDARDPGLHTVVAVALDEAGRAATSAPVRLHLFVPPVTLVATGSVWRFLDTGVYPGDGWIQPGFTDGAWRQGPGQLGFGDGDEATLVSNRQQITVWFRHAFVPPGTGSWAQLSLRLLRDDGAVVYLNGFEILRSNMPTGTVTAATRASSSVTGGDERTNYYAYAASGALLAPGTNWLAAEVHQVTNTSTDLSFDLEIKGWAPEALPALRIDTAPGGVSLAWPYWAQGWTLRHATSLPVVSAWATVTGTPAVLTNGRQALPDPGRSPLGFYMLSRP